MITNTPLALTLKNIISNKHFFFVVGSVSDETVFFSPIVVNWMSFLTETSLSSLRYEQIFKGKLLD